ncbi:hypothetical protein VTI74DRAFT_11557 [Chaetomium olivicolor]
MCLRWVEHRQRMDPEERAARQKSVRRGPRGVLAAEAVSNAGAEYSPPYINPSCRHLNLLPAPNPSGVDARRAPGRSSPQWRVEFPVDRCQYPERMCMKRSRLIGRGAGLCIARAVEGLQSVADRSFIRRGRPDGFEGAAFVREFRGPQELELAAHPSSFFHCPSSASHAAAVG